MDSDSSLVATLVARLSTRLPHRTGSNSKELSRDEVVVLTRSTLVNVSIARISLVIHTLVTLLEDLAKSYQNINAHPVHILHSELFVIELLAECCSRHWGSLNSPVGLPTDDDGQDSETDFSGSTHGGIDMPESLSRTIPEVLRRGSQNQHHERDNLPSPLDKDMAFRVIDAVKMFSRPISDNYVLPAANILDDVFKGVIPADMYSELENASHGEGSMNDPENIRLLLERSEDIDTYTRSIIEYVSASNWPQVLDYLKNSLRGLRTNTGPSPRGSSGHKSLVADNDKSALTTIRLISSLWVDSYKLSIIIQELCGSFLHLRKAFQITVAIVLPMLITRWLERNPEEFVELHTLHKRLDGGAETLFDMTNTMTDNAKQKSLLYPFQISLLFLLPDVYEVASNMRDARTSSLSKKVSFLEMLRKALRNRNETAIYCLTSVLRVARHFDAKSDAALLSFALDVQEEIRDAVFRRHNASGIDSTHLSSGLITAAFVSLAHLDFNSCVENLAPLCLSTHSPVEFKVAVISACTHFSRQPNVMTYQPLFAKVAQFIQVRLRTTSSAPRESYRVEQYTILKPVDATSYTEIIYNVLLFLDASPLTLLISSTTNGGEWVQFFEEIFASFMTYKVADDHRIRHLTNSVARKIMTDSSLSLQQKNQNLGSRTFKYSFWKSTSMVLLSAAEKLITSNVYDKPTLSFIHDYLESRLSLLRTIEELTDVDEQIPEQAAASTKLETAFLVSLSSTDVPTCQLITTCISLYCEQSLLISSAARSEKSSLSIIQNMDIYQQLSSRDFRFTGLVAFQKRVRGLLRQFTVPTSGILAAWENIFDKWFRLSKQLLLRPADNFEEKSILEWRNYSGFLASLGGTCVADQLSTPDDSTLAAFLWIDKKVPESDDDTLLSKYLKLSVQLLGSSNVIIRETTREVLSNDISPALHIPLFETLENELGVLFDSTRVNGQASVEPRVSFAEQSAAVLKSILDRLGSPTETGASLSIDIGALTLNFAKFIGDISDMPGPLRVKMKICQLCETLTKKKELLNLRHDVRIRNQLLEVIFGWIGRPITPRDGSIPGVKTDELHRLQRDLDKACLKALADLTYRLPLQPAEGQTDADTSDLKSQMFHQYFDRFLSLLNYESTEVPRNEARLISAGGEETATTPELAITALSNLLSANIDVGLKHSLSIGYHEDLNIRTAFVKVLCNILVQGSEFSNLSDAAVNKKYDELLHLLINDMALTIAICDACPSSEIDEMTIALLNIFDSRNLGFVFLEALIEHEVEETENEAELLRRNCVATKMLSVYAKWKGAAYLKATLQKVVERLVITSKDLDLELDPTRTNSTEELHRNALQLQVVAKVFIDDICTSSPNMPMSFRKICYIISSAVMKRFPEARFTAVGAFIFLRFFCPAIVAPDSEGLISSPPSKEMRRGLLLIAKVVQNLANNVLFGAKEQYMYPLNDFLAENIYKVTTFLREISVPPKAIEPVTKAESFDFGSCVALHRFLYDHWDHIRQKLVLQERKDSSWSPRLANKGQVPMLEALRRLITNLGPPPTDVSWNRPSISMNTPGSYSRFQHFMIRNAGRSTEAVISSRAVYDGGESRDGLSMICIILRNIDTETVDYDLLMYCYLKIASRMWHKPFGILVDSTSYNGQFEPQDKLLERLDSLTPVELSKQLSKIYIYNMNSAYRKFFRRIMRHAIKNESSALHPKHVEYQLIGSFQELQSYFLLTHLHLPQETINVVTDTKYVYTSVVRLSKTRGKVEVVLKVGDQYVQITTAKKQEIVPGVRLNATLNDIFRLSEVDEAPTSIQTEDDSAFGLRTENGKMIMYFTSPKKHEILQAIKGAKHKHGKETKTQNPFERLVRPQDVPGTLLNIALTNMACTDQILRLSSYNLLGALCSAFKFSAQDKFMSTKELCVPLNPSNFIIEISQQLARSEPQLTGDFLNEFFIGWDSFPPEQRPLSLAYMAPWLPGLGASIMGSEMDGDKGRERVATIFRKLIEIAALDVALSTTLEQSIWPTIRRDEVYIDLFLEEVVKAALSFGIDDKRTEILGSIVASLDTITLRGKLISRLRKSLNRTSLRPTKQLPDNTVWSEICVLLRLCLSISFDSGPQSQLYLPELFHFVTMFANTGSSNVRLMVHRLLVNTIHAICTSFTLEESKLERLKILLVSLSEPRKDSLLSMQARENGPMPANVDGGVPVLVATEALATLLSEITLVAAPTIDLSNVWRSRWMSLVASTAFQSNPAIQPRAFTVMGCLAREDVDDDLLYQVLVALRTSIARFMDDHDSEMLVSIVTSMTKMMDKLPSASRYGLQLFWLAISLVRLLPLNLFNCAALFLDSVISNIATSGDFQNGRMVTTLLHGRETVEDAALRLDEIYGIRFDAKNFHFAVCASLVKGLTDSVTKATTLHVLATFLETTSSNMPQGVSFPDDMSCLPYLELLMSRAATRDEARKNLWLSGMAPIEESVDAESILRAINLKVVKDDALLLNVAIGITDFRYLEDKVQNRGLLWLNSVAKRRPTIILHLCTPIIKILDHVLMSCQNDTTLESAHQLLRTLNASTRFSGGLNTAEMLEDVLEDIGFGGLWRSSTFHTTHEQDRTCNALTDRLIELIVA